MTLSLQIPTPLGDVCLEEDGSGFRSEMPPELCFQGLGFGGYSAAVAALAGFTRMPGRALRSMHAVFTAPAKPGRLEVAARVLSTGRSSGLCEVTLEQGGALVLTGLAWFVDPRMMNGPAGTATQPISYDGCDSVPWVTELAPFLKGLNVRAVDYPLTYDDFHDGQARVAMWAVPDAPAGADPRIAEISGRLTDIMFFDAFLLDAGMRTESPQTRMISLDLSVIWSAGHEAPAPTLLEADGRIDHKLATMQGTLRGTTGPARASATSQCRVFRAQRESLDS
ncbi:acyl-CoA thioesterase domain-containing protein [Nocardia sp. NPDC059195]|uniref:acyl-CoA thioesterase domain-containing protein n=1 Tax=Nocardia sp. NPDC059195 TaxID=3346765 RepID=UPI0036C0D2E6